ncbi:DUF2969 domain-containing protein [Enterococcus sp. MJM12]|uniref:DUF2969 domain-containing protein n=1 Tax=Candidatus Enterococcus myersii TaxID=2815322 RepID=A0ABS3HAU3_9ENTE|nr:MULTISPECIES: DUF2969 domain-containing protein [Enterococcus]MBO0450278.1 DUF2969 domain-containing protein [Enterococcus sp. MJM12]MCD1023935.1 DUF2969 domain-containing protein [Enterococcus sp. SMC-9]MDT2739620.1 DUF2969 domain-containing protein [Enterococcus canintestini]WHA10546.1 DUF2969 domain-containing protein [Enterococcus montenegrensis]
MIKYFSEVRSVTKKKDIEVKVEEVKKDIKGKNYTVNQLSIGKKVIGEILTMGEKNYEAFLGKEDLGAYKSLDLAVEAVLLQHNLHD